jgi:N-acetyl-anhydromuramyl-L-alanine amidase AmpD
MKIAVPTEATAGTRIEITPRTIAATPTIISAFQLRLSPSRTSGSSDAPPMSMEKKLDARADALRR